MYNLLKKAQVQFFIISFLFLSAMGFLVSLLPTKSNGQIMSRGVKMSGDVTGLPTATVVASVGGVTAAKVATAGNRTALTASRWLKIPWETSHNGTIPGTLAANNDTLVILFQPAKDITVAGMYFQVTTLLAASKMGVGIYTEDGNTRLIDSGAVDTSTAGVKATTGLNVTLSADSYYWLAYNVTSTTTLSWAGTNVQPGVENGSITRCGKAANASSGGQLPATLGAITPFTVNGTAIQYPVVKLVN